MPNEPLLTRKSYKEQLEKQNRELEELEEKQSTSYSKIRAQKVQSFLKRMACFSSGSFNYHSCDSNVLLE